MEVYSCQSERTRTCHMRGLGIQIWQQIPLRKPESYSRVTVYIYDENNVTRIYVCPAYIFVGRRTDQFECRECKLLLSDSWSHRAKYGIHSITCEASARNLNWVFLTIRVFTTKNSVGLCQEATKNKMRSWLHLGCFLGRFWSDFGPQVGLQIEAKLAPKSEK